MPSDLGSRNNSEDSGSPGASSQSRVTCENGVSSRVEACRKRLRMVRGDQKGTTETVEAGVFAAPHVEVSEEVSGGIETTAERLDEAGIT